MCGSPLDSWELKTSDTDNSLSLFHSFYSMCTFVCLCVCVWQCSSVSADELLVYEQHDSCVYEDALWFSQNRVSLNGQSQVTAVFTRFIQPSGEVSTFEVGHFKTLKNVLIKQSLNERKEWCLAYVWNWLCCCCYLVLHRKYVIFRLSAFATLLNLLLLLLLLL